MKTPVPAKTNAATRSPTFDAAAHLSTRRLDPSPILLSKVVGVHVGGQANG
jgi:hypothetical protein